MWLWWNSIGTTMFSCYFLVALVLVSPIPGCLSLNDEGLALLQFRAGVDYDPHDALSSWNDGDADPCSWDRVYCKEGRVEILNLSRLSLRGTLAPDLGRLSHLRSLVLYKNRFYGAIPEELERLKNLELLDLRCNDLRGTIPAEIGNSPSLKHLLVFDDEFEGHVSLEINEVNLLSEFQFHENVMNRKLGDSIVGNSLRKLNKEDLLMIPIRGVLTRFLNALPLPLPVFKFGSLTHSFSGVPDRRLLHQTSHVLAQPSPLPEPSSTNNPVQHVPLPEPSSTNILVQPAPLPESSNTNIPVQPVPLPESSHTNIPLQPVPMPESSHTNIPVHHPVPLPEPSHTNIPVQPAPIPVKPTPLHIQHAPLPEPSSTNNLLALPPPPAPAPLTPAPIITLPTSRSSGSFPAAPTPEKTPTAANPSPKTSSPVPVKQSNHKPDSASGTSTSIWERYGKYIIAFLGLNLLFILSAMLVVLFHRRGMTAIRPWKTGLSGQLQKAFITGVPKLNRSELDVACEDFSNIIETLDTCTVYKGTLSSGVEIAVAAAALQSSKDWSNSAEKAFWKKIDTLSRVNHKNFVNLIGYCEEDEPFTRMMVFEYAPNGTFFEHLHDEGVEHLDWSARMRIVMGTAYYLQYIHHDLNPPVAHSDLHSKSIILTDDYAAKTGDIIFSPKCKPKISGEEESSEPPPAADTKANVYSFGMLLLETITGKPLHSEEHGSLSDWASQYLNDKNTIERMIDPTLKTFNNNELDVLCDIIQDCTKPDPKQRPTMQEIVSRLRGMLSISPEQAAPRLSPLWWAELEILSAEAA